MGNTNSVNRLFAFLLSVSATLFGCATLDEAPKSADQLFEQGMESLRAGYFQTAVKHFDSLAAQYPFGANAPEALLAQAYAHYKLDEPESSLTITNQFIKTYPRDPHIDYAYYLRGLAYFSSNDAFGDDIAGLDPALRDPKLIRQSFQYFAEMIRRFPDSPYASDARARMVYLRNFLARHEIHVARYLLRSGSWLAAVQRAINVIENYPRTPAVKAALEIMAEGYDRLGISDLAGAVRRVAALNFPDESGRAE